MRPRARVLAAPADDCPRRIAPRSQSGVGGDRTHRRLGGAHGQINEPTLTEIEREGSKKVSGEQRSDQSRRA